MACRIKNLGTHLVCVDLVGAESMYLRPGETSGPLRDERLIANPYLSEWERAGIIQRVRVPLSEVLAVESPRDSVPALVASTNAGPAADASQAGGDELSAEGREKRREKDRRRKADTKTEE